MKRYGFLFFVESKNFEVRRTDRTKSFLLLQRKKATTELESIQIEQIAIHEDAVDLRFPLLDCSESCPAFGNGVCRASRQGTRKCANALLCKSMLSLAVASNLFDSLLDSRVGSSAQPHPVCICITFLFFYRRTSIDAARIVDDFKNPEKTLLSSLCERRIVAGPMRGAVHADLKHLPAGAPSTFAAARYYSDASRKRRDELLAKYSGKESPAEL